MRPLDAAKQRKPKQHDFSRLRTMKLGEITTYPLSAYWSLGPVMWMIKKRTSALPRDQHRQYWRWVENGVIHVRRCI